MEEGLGASMFSGMTPEEWQQLMAMSGGMPVPAPAAPDAQPTSASTVANSLADAARTGARAVVGGVNAVTSNLGIPQGDIKNAQGDVVFPTNALERGLQASDEAANQYAAAFVGPGGAKVPRGGAARPPIEPPPPPPPMGHNMPPEPMQVEAPAPTSGRAAAITSYNLRDTPLPQAIEIARQEQHIIPQKDGGYVGAPNSVRSPEDLQRMRDSFDEAVRQGASVGGDKWYETGRNVVKEIAPNNPKQQATVAQSLGLFSAQATPETNLGFMLKAHNAYEGGEPAALARTTAQADKYNQARDAGTDIPLGKKTFIYGENLDPNKPWTTTGTNDIWHARAFDYRDAAGKPWDSALTPQQHAFLDAETVLAVDRANKAKLGGRDNWTAPEIQAAGWVGRRGQGQVATAQAKGEDANIADELATASKGYKDALEKHTAYGTSEATPGVGTGHLPAVAEGSQALRDEYAADPRSSYSPGGYDVFHGAMGFLRRPTLKTTGMYEGPKGPEINQGEAARSLMDIDPGNVSGERTWSPVSKRMITAAEAAKGYTGAQNMSAASMLFTKNKPGRMGSLAFESGGQWSPEQINAVKAIGSKYGIPDPVHLGDKAYLSNFENAPAGMSLGTQKTMGDELSQALGRNVNPQRAEVASTTTFHGPEFAKGYGSGAATRQLREVLQAGPNYIQKLDASPEVRQQVLGQLQRDEEYAARTNSPLRQDLQNARRIIVNEGFAGLFKALDAGKVVLPALAGLMTMLPGLMPKQPQPQQGM